MKKIIRYFDHSKSSPYKSMPVNMDLVLLCYKMADRLDVHQKHSLTVKSTMRRSKRSFMPFCFGANASISMFMATTLQWKVTTNHWNPSFANLSQQHLPGYSECFFSCKGMTLPLSTDQARTSLLQTLYPGSLCLNQDESLREGMDMQVHMLYSNLPVSKQTVAMDLFTWNNEQYIITHYYSRYFELDKLHSTTASTVIHKLKAAFARHGIAETVISDNGPQYKCKEF